MRLKSVLQTKTHNLLRAHVILRGEKHDKLQEIAEATGLSYHWLDKFYRDVHHQNAPSATRLEILLAHLKGSPVKVR